MNKLHLNDDEWFEPTDEGLFHLKVTIKDGKRIPISSQLTYEPFEIIGRPTPLDGHYERGLRIRHGDRRLTVARAEIASDQNLARWLHDAGVEFNSQKKGLLSLYFSATKAPVIRAYTRSGWQKDGAFCVGDQIIGSKEPEACVVRAHAAIGEFEASGTFEEWQDNVLRLAYQKPGWIFGILEGLSSPLLRVVGASIGYGFNLTGRSSTGKTVALQAGAGAWGLPEKHAALKTFNTTINGIEALAEGQSDMGLFLDEMKHAKTEIVTSSIYGLSEGSGKTRLDQSAEVKRVRHWRVNTMTTSEKTIEDIFDAAGINQAAGQVLRFIDVDAEPLLPDLPRAKVHEFERALKRFYGTAGPELVRRIQNADDEAIVEAWEVASSVLYDGEDNRIRRVAEGFALLVVAGDILGIETSVVKVAFDHWRESGVDEALDDNFQIAKKLLTFVQKSIGSSILPLRSESPDDGDAFASHTGEEGSTYQKRDGWISENPDDDSGEAPVVWLLPDTLDKLRGGHNRNLFYRWLGQRGIIAPRVTKKGARGWTHRVPGLRSQAMAVKIDLSRLREVVSEA